MVVNCFSTLPDALFCFREGSMEYSNEEKLLTYYYNLLPNAGALNVPKIKCCLAVIPTGHTTKWCDTINYDTFALHVEFIT